MRKDRFFYSCMLEGLPEKCDSRQGLGFEVYTILIGEGKGEGHLWENKLLLGKINGSVEE